MSLIKSFYKKRKNRDKKIDSPVYPFSLCENGSLYQESPVIWSLLLKYLTLYNKSSSHVYIPVHNDSFGLDYDYCTEISSLIKRGYIYAHAQLQSNVIMVSYCIEEGYRGDEDGFGVEPDTWIYAVLDKKGKYIIPFCYRNEELNAICLSLQLGNPPLDNDGRIVHHIMSPFPLFANDTKHKKITFQGLHGVINTLFNSVDIPCKYEEINIIHAGSEIFFNLKSPRKKYGLQIRYSGKEDIPTEYFSPFTLCRIENDESYIVVSSLKDGDPVYFKLTKITTSYWKTELFHNQSGFMPILK